MTPAARQKLLRNLATCTLQADHHLLGSRWQREHGRQTLERVAVLAAAVAREVPRG